MAYKGILTIHDYTFIMIKMLFDHTFIKLP